MYHRAMSVRQQPDLTTAPELATILLELIDREPIFHRPQFGTTRADFERMMCGGFWETSASGRRFSRAFVLDELERRFSQPYEDVWETSGFCCRQLATGVNLLTYTPVQNHTRITRRATIWQRTAEGGKIAYHQGTIVA